MRMKRRSGPGVEANVRKFALQPASETIYAGGEAMTYDPKSIANYFIDLAAAEGKKLTPLQLIKLVYIAHGWYLGLTGKPLINESPQAWQYGPVIPSLYHALKIHGNDAVTY